MTKAAVKFLFDTEFGAAKPPSEPQVPLARHEAELAAAEARGRAAGAAEATAAGIAEAERRLAAALERIADEVAHLLAALARIEVQIEREATELAVAIGRKLAGALVAREPLAEITALASGCLAELRAAPHLVVRVNDALLAPVGERLDRVAVQCGFAGRVVVLAEPDIRLGDARIEWADGGVVHDTAEKERRIDTLVRRFLEARADGMDGRQA